MRSCFSTFVCWLAAINIFISGYVLWVFFQAMQYVPTTGSIPIEITGIQYGLLLFEFVGLIVSIGYFFNRRTDTMATFVYSIFILQIIAVFIAPFLIAARIWPRM